MFGMIFSSPLSAVIPLGVMEYCVFELGKNESIKGVNTFEYVLVNQITLVVLSCCYIAIKLFVTMTP